MRIAANSADFRMAIGNRLGSYTPRQLHARKPHANSVNKNVRDDLCGYHAAYICTKVMALSLVPCNCRGV